MDSPPKPPIVFANRVIRQYVDNLAGPEFVLLPSDYLAIRTAFRCAGGQWERLFRGNVVVINLLGKLVTGWASLPGRVKKTELG